MLSQRLLPMLYGTVYTAKECLERSGRTSVQCADNRLRKDHSLLLTHHKLS